MKLLHSNIITWWRIGLMAGGVVLASLAFFSFMLYQRVNMISSRSTPLSGEEFLMPLFSPALLDDIKAFWEKRNETLQE